MTDKVTETKIANRHFAAMCVGIDHVGPITISAEKSAPRLRDRASEGGCGAQDDDREEDRFALTQIP
jgi:hypothetical protein